MIVRRKAGEMEGGVKEPGADPGPRSLVLAAAGGCPVAALSPGGAAPTAAG